jgi:hypothetical protein
MTEMQAHLDKIRSDAAECLLLSSLVPSDKREMFVKIAQHLNNLAFEVERTMAKNGAKTAPIARQPDPSVTDLATFRHQKGSRSRRIFAWMLLLVVSAGIVAGAIFWESQHDANFSALFTVPSKHEPPPAPQGPVKPMIAAPVSGEQGERIVEQLGALAARVDDLARSLDNFKKASGEIVDWSNKEPVAAGEKHTAAGSKSSAPEHKRGANAAPSPEEAKPPAVVPPTSANPPNELADQVGTIPGEAELDRRATIGPAGCTHFRSFDAVSGTYTTLDGRRRPCR